jgi:NitT/TauT family transport system permease protein
MSHSSSAREEFETVLQPLTSVPLERELPLGQRLWQQSWLRKSLILILLAVLWEAASRYTNNDLLLPSFMQTSHALYDGLLSGELLGKVWISLVVLLKGYLIGIVLAFALTTLAVSTQLGRDLLSTLTSMFNPLPAIALLPLALLWFGLGQNSLIFVLVHSVLWALALNTYAGFLGVSETLRMAGRNYGLKGMRFRAVHPDSGGTAVDSGRAENRLGVCLAHLDCRGVGVWRHQRQGWVGLVHLSESQ